MPKQRKAKFVIDQELGSIKDIKSIKQVAEDEEAYKDILKDAVITRVANKGDNYITQTITYNAFHVIVLFLSYDFLHCFCFALTLPYSQLLYLFVLALVPEDCSLGYMVSFCNDHLLLAYWFILYYYNSKLRVSIFGSNH